MRISSAQYFNMYVQSMGDQQSDRHPCCGDGCGQRCKQEIVLAGEDADREPDADNDQHERVDSGVEKTEVELSLGDLLVRHSEPVQDKRSDTDTAPCPTGQEQPAGELCPGDVVVHPLSAAVARE